MESYKTAFQSIIRDALREARTAYNELREENQDKNILDTSVDTITAVDTALTDVFKAYFDDLEDDYRIISEEGVKQGQGVSDNADYTVILDEIDGTNSLMRRVGHFGPILAIAEGSDPAFKDVIAAGYLDLHHDALYEAYRGEGAYKALDWPVNQSCMEIQTSGRKRLSEENAGGRATMLIDQYMVSGVPEIATLWQYAEPGDYRSSAQHLGWVADGNYDVFITGNHCAYTDEKKMTAEELAGGYLLITEAGGAIVNWEGDEIYEDRIGLEDQHTFDIIAATTSELADEVVEKLPEQIRD